MTERARKNDEYKTLVPLLTQRWTELLASANKRTAQQIMSDFAAFTTATVAPFGRVVKRNYTLQIGKDTFNFSILPSQAFQLHDQLVRIMAATPLFHDEIAGLFPRIVSSLPEITQGSTREALLDRSLLEKGQQTPEYPVFQEVLNKFRTTQSPKERKKILQQLNTYIHSASQVQLVAYTRALRREAEYYPVTSKDCAISQYLDFLGYDGSAYISNWTLTAPSHYNSDKSDDRLSEYCDLISFEQNILRFFELLLIDTELANRLYQRNNILSLGMYPLETLIHVDKTYQSPQQSVLWIQNPDDWNSSDYEVSIPTQYDLLRQLEAMGMRVIVLEALTIKEITQKLHTIRNSPKGKLRHMVDAVVVNTHGYAFGVAIAPPARIQVYTNSTTGERLSYEAAMKITEVMNDHRWENLHITRIIELLSTPHLRRKYKLTKEMIPSLAAVIKESIDEGWEGETNRAELEDMFSTLPGINDILSLHPITILGGCNLGIPTRNPQGYIAAQIPQIIANKTQGMCIAQKKLGKIETISLRRIEGKLVADVEYNHKFGANYVQPQGRRRS